MSERRNIIRQRGLIVGVAATLVVTVVACFFVPMVGQDSRVHLHWLGMFPQLVADGTLYPRWLPESLSGFGSPAFYFYPPAAYWLASLVALAGPTKPETLYAVSSVIALVASGATAYIYLTEIASTRKHALLGALMYCVFPYRIIDLFVRNAFSEHLAFVFLPLLLLAVRASGKGAHWRSAFWAAIGTAGLLLSNIPTAVIVAYTVPFLLWANGSFSKARRMSLLFLLGGAFIGVLAACIYILPANEFSDAISYENLWILTGGKHSLAGYAILELFLNQSFRVFAWSLTAVFGIALALAWLQQKRRDDEQRSDPWVRWLLLFVAIVQLPYVLGPVLAFLPMMDLTQFVWRWYLWLPLVLALLIASYQRTPRTLQLLTLASLLISIGIGVVFYRSTKQLDTKQIEAPHEAPEYVSAKASLSYEEEVKALASHKRDQEVVRTNGSVAISAVERYDADSYFTASVTSESASLVLHRLYFPTWRLRDEIGVEYPVTADTLGRVTVTIPKGKRNYVLTLVESNTERISEWISGLGVLLTVVLGAFTVRERKRAASLPSSATSTPHSTAATAPYPKSGS